VAPRRAGAPENDPLGVRGDFPVVENGVYLNSAYITPVPLAVAAAARAFADAKARSPIPLDDMLKKADEVRGRFARLIGATGDEIGFLFATSEGENIVAAALDLKRGDNVVEFDATRIHTHTFALGDLPTALRYARDRVEDAIKVVVTTRQATLQRGCGPTSRANQGRGLDHTERYRSLISLSANSSRAAA